MVLKIKNCDCISIENSVEPSQKPYKMSIT